MKRGAGAGLIAIAIFMIIFFTVVFLVSSGTVGDILGPKQETIQGGTEALALSFYKLPTQVSKGQEFDIDVIAENRGDYTIPIGKVRAVLNDAKTFGIDNAVQINSESIIEDDEAWFKYPKAKYISRSLGKSFNVGVGVCYPYKTIPLVKDVCLAPSKTNDLCEFRESKEVENRKAPIHLVSFTQLDSTYYAGEEYLIMITKLKFENRGSGKVYSPEAKCGDISIEHANKISIESITLGTNKLTGDNLDKACGLHNGIVDLEEKAITCNLRQSGIKTDAISVISMTLSYLYEQQLSESIGVIHGVSPS